jgi:hypothetical protein
MHRLLTRLALLVALLAFLAPSAAMAFAPTPVLVPHPGAPIVAGVPTPLVKPCKLLGGKRLVQCPVDHAILALLPAAPMPATAVDHKVTTGPVWSLLVVTPDTPPPRLG